MVVDGNHRFRDLDRPMLAQGYDLRPLTIEDDATVTHEVHDHRQPRAAAAFIGANSVVTRDVPAVLRRRGCPGAGGRVLRPARSGAGRALLELRDVGLSGAGAARPPARSHASRKCGASAWRK